MSVCVREILAVGADETGISLSEKQLDQFDIFTNLLLEWNQKMNLTRITDPCEIAVKHYLDSLSILAFLKMAKGASVIDVGTGAGFPGIPLKIVRPDLKVVFLDSVRKKLSFIEAAAEVLGMSDVQFVHSRAEEAGQDREYRERFDFALSRAVSRLVKLVWLCMPFCRIGGRFAAYKGPAAQEEISEAQHVIKLLGGKVEAIHEFVLPRSDSRRTIAIIRKVRRTPQAGRRSNPA